MTKTFALAFALASVALAAAAPAQAATRSVDIHAELFADRCSDQGGVISSANPTLVCETPKTVIACSFVTLNKAWCQWPGIDGQIAVNRIIGMQSAQSVNGTGGVAPSGNGGGIQLPDFPLDNGNGGGGGIQLPDLPLDNGNGGGGIQLPDLPMVWN